MKCDYFIDFLNFVALEESLVFGSGEPFEGKDCSYSVAKMVIGKRLGEFAPEGSCARRTQFRTIWLGLNSGDKFIISRLIRNGIRGAQWNYWSNIDTEPTVLSMDNVYWLSKVSEYVDVIKPVGANPCNSVLFKLLAGIDDKSVAKLLIELLIERYKEMENCKARSNNPDLTQFLVELNDELDEPYNLPESLSFLAICGTLRTLGFTQWCQRNVVSDFSKLDRISKETTAKDVEFGQPIIHE